MTDEPKALVLQSSAAIMPVMDIEMALARRQLFVDYTRKLMVDGRDYGTIPGTGDKPTLKKPGAEKLCSLFGLAPVFDTVAEEMDWTGERHGGEPFFYIRCRCRLLRQGEIVGEGIGSCNSWEKKYRYRRGERVCPNCGKAAIIKSDAQYGGGWLCWKKKDGCGSKFADGDRAIEAQEVGQVKNTDPADIVNTIDKMAQKRALVAATLIAVNASEFYTQDVEDYADVIEGHYTAVEQPLSPTSTSKVTIVAPAPVAPKVTPKPEPEPSLPGLLDDEVVIRETPAGQFLPAAAGLLGVEVAAVKDRMKALGYTTIPGDPGLRVKAYRALKTTPDEVIDAAIDDLFGEKPATVANHYDAE